VAPYTVTFDITSDVKSLPLFTDTGTGEVNQATIIIRALKGQHITLGGVLFDFFDRIRIQCTDLGGNSYDRYFEIINIIPSQTKNEGSLITLECLGIEYHTQQIHMSKPYYFEDSYTVGLSVGDIYNASRGDEQPLLSNYNVVFTEGNGFGSALPFFNANNWEFGLNEDSCYNRWMDLLEGAGAPVSSGGALKFYELNFLTTGVNALDFKLRESGDNTSIVQVQNAVATGVRVGEQEGMISNPTGTNVLAWGSPDHGTLPINASKYESALLQFIFRPEWVTSILYQVDARVKVTDTSNPQRAPKHYKCLEEHTSGTFATDLAAAKWVQIDMAEEFGNSIQQSPWTDDKATLWGNNGCDPSRVTFTTAGWCDINLVINEEDFFRTWVDARARTDAELDTLATGTGGYSYDGTRSGFPDGFRILVDAGAGAATGDLANFDDMVVERVPVNSTGTSTWRKLYSFDTANDQVEVAVIHEGKVYADTITGTPGSPSHSWSDISGADYGNDCFHQYTTAPANVDGEDLVLDPAAGIKKHRSDVTDSTNRPDITKSGGTFTSNQDSGVKFVTVAADAITNAASDASDPLAAYYNNAIGFNLRFPFPNNTFNSIAESVGGLYGGGAISRLNLDWVTSTPYFEGSSKVFNNGGFYMAINDHTSGASTEPGVGADWQDEWIRLVGKQPATLDQQNMNYTHDGQQGFNAKLSASEDFGQINAVAMWLKYSVVESAGSTELNDEHRFRAFFIDTKDNVVYQDFVIRFSNNWEDIRLPIGGFRIYKGRKPVYGFDAAIATLFPPKELETINIFEWRNIKIFGVQLQSQYDKYGRFNPNQQIIDESGNSVTWSNILGSTRTLEMDGFRFVKPLLVTSGPKSDRNIEPDFLQLPNITVYDQLLNAAKSHLEIEKFQHKEFNIESVGDEIFDIPFGDGFYLKNEDLVSDDDKAGEDNNILLVAKRIEYSITKPPGGKGGLRRKLNGSKVFT